MQYDSHEGCSQEGVIQAAGGNLSFPSPAPGIPARRLRSGTRPAEVPVGLQHVVKIRTDRDLVVGEVGQPGPIAGNGIRQKRQDVSERHLDAPIGRFLDNAEITESL